MEKDPLSVTQLPFAIKGSVSRKIRELTVIGLVLDACILALELTNVMHANTVKHVNDCAVFALLCLLFAFPAKTWILAVIGIAECAVNIYYGGHILGFLFFAFGLAVLLREGFFRTGAFWKSAALAAFLIAVTLSQLWTFDLKRFTVTVVNVAVASTLLLGFMYIFHDSLRNLYREKPVLDLSKGGLTARQLSCVRGCLEGKRVHELAAELVVSDSVVKKKLLVIYEALGASDYRELRYRLENSRVRFPDSAPEIPEREESVSPVFSG